MRGTFPCAQVEAAFELDLPPGALGQRVFAKALEEQRRAVQSLRIGKLCFEWQEQRRAVNASLRRGVA